MKLLDLIETLGQLDVALANHHVHPIGYRSAGGELIILLSASVSQSSHGVVEARIHENELMDFLGDPLVIIIRRCLSALSLQDRNSP